MSRPRTKRQKAIARRNRFLAVCTFVIIAVIVAAVFGIKALIPEVAAKPDDTSSNNSSVGNMSSDISSKEDEKNTYDPDDKQMIEVGGVMLDANFRRILLVNGENPLPETYDSEITAQLVEIDAKYRNNNYVTKIHKDVYPYITAMVAKAQSDGVDLRVWSPFRSYSIQNGLFQNQVAKMKNQGYTGKAAEDKAATVVARPGTSEHNTGLCADFNMASDRFEQTKMFEWMCENAEDYGFILRYPKSKIDITGVIYESWHWRFVGINTAKEINELGVTLEEYIELKGIDPTEEL